MLRGDSVNIREGGCWGWLLRFPGCHPHLSRRAGVSLCLRPDAANNHWTVIYADPQVQSNQFSLPLICRSNNGRITIFQEIMLLSILISELCFFVSRDSASQPDFFIPLFYFFGSGIAQSVKRPRGWSSSPGRSKIFLLSTLSRPALAPNGYRELLPRA
jgi:hypothetical protein